MKILLAPVYLIMILQFIRRVFFANSCLCKYKKWNIKKTFFFIVWFHLRCGCSVDLKGVLRFFISNINTNLQCQSSLFPLLKNVKSQDILRFFELSKTNYIEIQNQVHQKLFAIENNHKSILIKDKNDSAFRDNEK